MDRPATAVLLLEARRDHGLGLALELDRDIDNGRCRRQVQQYPPSNKVEIAVHAVWHVIEVDGNLHGAGVDCAEEAVGSLCQIYSNIIPSDHALIVVSSPNSSAMVLMWVPAEAAAERLKDKAVCRSGTAGSWRIKSSSER